jgi:hypothetical protein
MPSIHQRLGEKAERAWEMVVNEQKIRHSGAPVPSRPTGATQRALTCAFFCTKGLSGSAGAIHPRRRFAGAKNLLRTMALHRGSGCRSRSSAAVLTLQWRCARAAKRGGVNFGTYS